MTTRTPLIAVASAAVFVWTASSTVVGQHAGLRTPWGDPDLQGTYTNTYENGTPLERPDQFAGRRLEDIRGEELASMRREIQKRSASSSDPSTPRRTGGRTICISIAAARRGWSWIRPTARSRR
jgi:hypothetical protein